MNLAESLGFVPQKTARAVRAINVGKLIPNPANFYHIGSLDELKASILEDGKKSCKRSGPTKSSPASGRKASSPKRSGRPCRPCCIKAAEPLDASAPFTITSSSTYSRK